LGPIDPSKYKVIKREGGVQPGQVPLFKQANYKSISYPGGDNPNGDIATSGCGVVSTAMVLSYYGKGSSDPKVLIQELATYALQNGYRKSGTAGTIHGFFSAIAKREGLEHKALGTDWEKISTELKAGHPVIASGRGAAPFVDCPKDPLRRCGHIVVLTGITKDGLVTVNDPARSYLKTPTNYSPEVIKSGLKNAYAVYK
jgi:Peptidase_C39 like family